MTTTQLPTAWRFSVRNQARNRFAWLLLTGFVPVWYLLMLAITGHQSLTFRLFATGRLMSVDGGHMSLITGGLSSVTIIVGSAVFIMGGLMDTFLQNPLGNPLASNRVLEWFPSFGPTQFAVGGALAHTGLWQYLTLGLVWPAALATAGLVTFTVRTRVR